MGLTVGQRLWLGFGLIVALIAAAYYYLVHADLAPAPEPAEPAAVESVEAIGAAASRMSAALDAAAAAVQGYERNTGQAARDALIASRAEFEAGLADYLRAAGSEAQRAQSQDLMARFTAAASQAQESMSAIDARAEQIAAFDRFRAEGATLVAQQPRVAGRPNRGRTLRKQNVVNELTGQLRAKGREYTARAAGAPLPQSPSRTALLANLSRYEVLADTAAERDWAAKVRGWIERGERQWSGTSFGAAGQAQSLAEAQKAFAAIEPGIDQLVQANLSADRAQLEARLAQADERLSDERRRTEQVLLALLGASAVIALLAILGARAPLKRWAALARPYVDADLTYQMLTLRGDETRELNVALPWLIERLQHDVAPAEPDGRTLAALRAFEETRQPMALLDGQRQVLRANPAFCELAGRDEAALAGRPLDELWSGDHHDDTATQAMWSFAQDQGEWQGELWLRDAADNVHPLWGYLSRIRDQEGGCTGFVLACGDVTSIRMAERQSARAASASAANANALAQRLRAGVSRANRHGRCVALMHIAVAQLEGVDRILGREEADALLKVAAERLQRLLRGHDAILRVADDQFVVLLEDVDEPEQARHVAEKILSEFSVPVELSGLELPLHAKIGIAVAPQDGGAAELPEAAHAALLRAGQTRGAAFAFHAPGLNERMWADHALATELRRSDLEQQLALRYRPRVAAMDGQRMVGVQACLRWMHPDHGALAPGRFLQAAPHDVALRLDAWQIGQACAQLQAWGNENALPVALELVSRRLDIGALGDAVASALQRHAVTPRLLELEFPISVICRADEAEGLFTRLAASGVGLSVTVDDVEAFTRSLGQLRRLPLARVKLGHALVEGIGSGASEQALARATLTLARSLGVELTAEGVDTQAQSVFLRTEGILHQQGALFGEPAPAQSLDAHRESARAGSRAPA